MDSEKDGVKSPEAQAEEILRNALKLVQDEECLQGDVCPIHHRVDEVYLDEEYEYARLITYVGEYVVLTDDNPAASSAVALVKMLFGGPAAHLPTWETAVYWVGDGTLSDLLLEDFDERSKGLRYAETHDDWEHVSGIHETIVEGVRAGLIDVSKPVTD
jgi:hypothetical protein